jgi:hypothetical protein
MQDGEITLSDIEALPFVENSESALLIAAWLAQSFDVETYQRRKPTSGSGSWEDVIRLKVPGLGLAEHPERAARIAPNPVA